MIFKGKKIDFIDFGASKGGSIEFAKRALNGKHGLGIDLSPDKVSNMQKLGYECIEGDITDLNEIPDNSVRFVTISHVLEHLPSLLDIKKAINEAVRISTDFVFIQGPYFDADDYLRKLGLKFYWSDWYGHTYHLRIPELENILTNQAQVIQHKVLVRVPIKVSGDSNIHSVDSPIDQHEYNPKIHPYKRDMMFNSPIYKEIVAYIRVGKINYWALLINARKGCFEIDGKKVNNSNNMIAIGWRQYLTIKWILTRYFRMKLILISKVFNKNND